MVRLFIYLIGFGMLVIGGINSIAYLNILTMGNDWAFYLLFILTEPGCVILIIGLILIFISTYKKQINGH